MKDTKTTRIKKQKCPVFLLNTGAAKFTTTLSLLI